MPDERIVRKEGWVSEEVSAILQKWGYELLQVVGKGAFSQVYCVKEASTGSLYACKVSDKQEMLGRESEILRRLSHPLFPEFHDYRQEKERSFLLMEYVSGVNLKEWITQKGVLSEESTIAVALELAKGLRYLHELTPPVLFRDMKPDNIMVGTDREVRLLDLGSAGSPDAVKRVMTGTPGFAAPEQWEPDGMEGFYSDVYGLAEVMYYMLTGEYTEAIRDGRRRIRISGRKVHRGVEVLLEECLREESRERIPDMRYFLQRLEPYYRGEKGKILKLEIAAYLRKKKEGEYVFVRNILLG